MHPIKTHHKPHIRQKQSIHIYRIPHCSNPVILSILSRVFPPDRLIKVCLLLCGQSSPLIPQILGKPEIPDRYYMNEYGYEEQHDDLSVVPTLAGVLPDLELEHVAADVLDSLGLVEPHTGLLVLAHVVVVEEKVVHGGGHEDAPADGVRGLPDLLSYGFCVGD